MEVKKYKLGEIADFNKENIGSTDKFTVIEYLDTSSITENVISGISVLNISDAPSRAQRKVTNNTIIYSTVRPRLKHYGILFSPKNNLIVSTGFVTIDVKDIFKDKIDARYLFLLLTQANITEYIGNIADTAVSAYPSINPTDISSIYFNFPDIQIQKIISDIWFNYDSKIELNRAINQNLEAMAKQLYDYWFVQFDFPDENGKPYKSSGGKMVWNDKLHLSIPSNWEAIPLSEIMDYAGGSQPPASEFIEEYRDGYVRFVQIRDYYSNSHITYIPIRKSNKLCTETDIMIARYGASLGRICYGLNGAYNVALAKVSPKVKEYTEYLRIFLMSDGFYDKINSIGQRAAQAGFNKDDIENILIPFPTNNRCIIEFNKKMQPYFFARLQNDKEINTLTKQRDELLLFLMNGQVSVNSDLSDD